MKATTTVIYLLLLWIGLTWGTCHAYAERYKIALVHSYEEGHVDAERTYKLLNKELRAHGLYCDFREYYLNCDELMAAEEEEQASLFIDDFTAWGADLVAVLDDQATYSLMACHNSKLHDIPVVFSGVNYPNLELLKQYPNVTGYADIPDYLNTVRMIERVMGKSRVCVINRNIVLDRIIWKNLLEQFQGTGYEIFDDDVIKHIAVHRTVKDGLFSVSAGMKQENERFDSTVIVRINSDSLSLTKLAWTGRGTHTLFLFTKRDFTTVNSANFFHNPCFETINEGFGLLDHKLGGYFAPLETQIKDMAQGISERLRGEMPDQQVKYCAKQYVLNWNTLQRYQIPVENIPKEYTIMYIPFVERYRYTLLYSFILASVLVLLFIVYLTRSLSVERKRKREAQRNLQYEHETLALAIEGGATYAWRLEEDGVIGDSQFYEFIHHPHTRISLEEILAFVHPDDRKEFQKNSQASSSVPSHKGQYRFNFTGEYQWWEIRYSTVFNAGGVKPAITGLLQNVQDVKDREAELIQARKLAEHAELKQSFLNNMSHEIRTPLNAIAGFSNMLVYEPELSEEEKLEYVDIINNNTKLLLKLVDDVLELSRIESGAMSFNLHRENIREVLESIYQTHSVLIHSPLEFIKDFPEEDAYVYIDSMRLTQVITNFLNNANKFTREGYIKLGYNCPQNKQEIHIYVEDTGMGISSDELKMIFERFYKHNEFSQGVGLGLSICMLIVEKLNGRITVESQEGKGSCFTVILPRIA